MTAFREVRWRSRDGLSLFARDYPAAGPHERLPIVCLHGITRNGRDFEQFAPWAVRRGRRVLAPDMRGRGLSDWDPEPEHYTPNTYVNDVLALLEFLGIPKAVFVGTSMGGIVVMALAVVAPQAIAACVLNDIGPIVAPEAIQRIKGYVGGTVSIANWSDAGEYAKLTNHVAFPEYSSEDWNRFARRLFREEAGIPKLDYDPRIADQLRNNRYSSPAEGAWREFGFLAQACPTLIIRGELSDVLSREIADRMKAAQPSVRLTEVPRVGHAPMLTEPAAAEAIADFLAQVP